MHCGSGFLPRYRCKFKTYFSNHKQIASFFLPGEKNLDVEELLKPLLRVLSDIRMTISKNTVFSLR